MGSKEYTDVRRNTISDFAPHAPTSFGIKRGNCTLRPVIVKKEAAPYSLTFCSMNSSSRRFLFSFRSVFSLEEKVTNQRGERPAGTGGNGSPAGRRLRTCAPSPVLAAPLLSLLPGRWRKSAPPEPRRQIHHPLPRLPPVALQPRRCWAARATSRAPPPPPRRAGPRPPSPTRTPGCGTRAVEAAPWPKSRRTA